jgi:hypothetical protein
MDAGRKDAKERSTDARRRPILTENSNAVMGNGRPLGLGGRNHWREWYLEAG